MKKIYTFMMALAVALSASALDFSKHSSRTIHSPKGASVEGVKVKKVSAVNKAPEEVLTIDDIVGTWEWMAYDMFEDDVIVFNTTVSIEDADEGIVVLNDFIESDLCVPAIFDAESCTLTIPYSIIMTDLDEDVDVAFSSFFYSLDDEGYLEEIYPDPTMDLVLEYDPEEKAFYNWEAIYGAIATIGGTPSDDMDYWFYLYNQAYITKSTAPVGDLVEDDADYEDCGFAELQDGWLYTAYGIDQTIYPHVVPLQKNVAIEGVYRLVDPFSAQGEHLVGKSENRSEEPGYIRFNLADPSLPYIYPNVFSGFQEPNMGKYYFYDFTGYQVEVKGEQPNFHYLSVMYGEARLSKYDEATKTIHIPVSYCGISGNKFGNITWVDEAQNPVDMASYIRLLPDPSGVDGINAADATAPTEFYNLQGVRVSNPANGVFIMRQGNEFKKVIR